ncbi:MAG: hypothetical protein LBJ20_04345 [Candidatus Methanoplasma sp.]|jgi:uncharacterized protein YwgA|nr:hypothetical protein [Candidatus Methanoplasma sp.]
MASVTIEELDQPHILALYAVNKATKGVPTKTHFQKIIYLIFKALGRKPEDAQFRAYHYGPYSDMVDDWREDLIFWGYLKKSSGSEVIRISPDMKEAVDAITPPNELAGFKIKEIVEFVCSLSWEELLLLIYTDDVRKNENMSSKSVAKDDIFKKRVEISLGMVKSEKISVARGAELADMEIREYMDLVSQKCT